MPFYYYSVLPFLSLYTLKYSTDIFLRQSYYCGQSLKSFRAHARSIFLCANFQRVATQLTTAPRPVRPPVPTFDETAEGRKSRRRKRRFFENDHTSYSLRSPICARFSVSTQRETDRARESRYYRECVALSRARFVLRRPSYKIQRLACPLGLACTTNARRHIHTAEGHTTTILDHFYN